MCSIENCQLESYENGKCILHCEKDDWYIEIDSEKNWDNSKINKFWIEFNKNNKGGKLREIHFPKCENILSHVKSEKEIFKYFFTECKFYDTISFNEYFPRNIFYFDNCSFNGDISFFKNIKCEFFFYDYCNFNNNSFYGNASIIDNDFSIFSCKNIKNINFNNIKIEGSFYIENAYLNGKADFNFANFKKEFSLNSSTFNSLEFYNTKFESNTFFSDLKILSADNEFDLSKSIFFNKSNFFNISVLNLNRETARMIKDSFEQQNNIIEANKFYALEMKEREKELNQDRKEGKNLLEWLVFKVHGLASNHSQDWLLSLCWILSFSFGYGFINCINEYLDTKLEFMLIDIFLFGVITLISVFVVESKRINNYMLIAIFYLIYGFASKDFNLFDISNNINPFSIMTGWQELSFLTLFYKIIIAYLIYQLIISI